MGKSGVKVLRVGSAALKLFLLETRLMESNIQSKNAPSGKEKPQDEASPFCLVTLSVSFLTEDFTTRLA